MNNDIYGRNGELTRGMLVIDRRDDVGSYELGANRAKVQAMLEAEQDVPAPVQKNTAGTVVVSKSTACVEKSIEVDAERNNPGSPSGS